MGNNHSQSPGRRLGNKLKRHGEGGRAADDDYEDDKFYYTPGEVRYRMD
jgi:hypothetical protein